MQTKTVFQLDDEGFLIGETVADESPLDEGVFLLPAGCVEIDPLPAVEGKRQQFVNGMFQYIDIPQGPAPVDELKAEKHMQVNAERDRREASGFSYLGKVFDSDPRSVLRINTAAQAAQAAIAAAQPFTIDWTCADDTTVQLDAEQLLVLPASLAARANLLHTYARSLKISLNEATEAELSEIDPLAGWPE
jgi:hypothetical protein